MSYGAHKASDLIGVWYAHSRVANLLAMEAAHAVVVALRRAPSLGMLGRVDGRMLPYRLPLAHGFPDDILDTIAFSLHRESLRTIRATCRILRKWVTERRHEWTRVLDIDFKFLYPGNHEMLWLNGITPYIFSRGTTRSWSRRHHALWLVDGADRPPEDIGN